MFVDNWYKEMLAFVKDDRTNNADPVQVVATDGTTGNYQPGWASWVDQYVYYTPMSFFNQRGDKSWNPTFFCVSNNAKVFFGSGLSSTTDPAVRGVVFGDGDTPVSMSDYWLSGNQIIDFTANSMITILQDGAKITGTATYTITNTGASSFTIKELGLTHYAHPIDKRVMIYRKVLETPLTIEPNNYAMLDISIDIF